MRLFHPPYEAYEPFESKAARTKTTKNLKAVKKPAKPTAKPTAKPAKTTAKTAKQTAKPTTTTTTNKGDGKRTGTLGDLVASWRKMIPGIPDMSSISKMTATKDKKLLVVVFAVALMFIATSAYAPFLALGIALWSANALLR